MVILGLGRIDDEEGGEEVFPFIRPRLTFLEWSQPKKLLAPV